MHRFVRRYALDAACKDTLKQKYDYQCGHHDRTDPARCPLPLGEVSAAKPTRIIGVVERWLHGVRFPKCPGFRPNRVSDVRFLQIQDCLSDQEYLISRQADFFKAFICCFGAVWEPSAESLQGQPLFYQKNPRPQ